MDLGPRHRGMAELAATKVGPRPKVSYDPHLALA
jgi:hypothetical protein